MNTNIVKAFVTHISLLTAHTLQITVIAYITSAKARYLWISK